MTTWIILVALACGIMGIAEGTTGLALASSSSAESEGINDEIVTFGVDCPEGYEFDDSGSTCIPSSAKDERVTETTWNECVNKYDVFVCAQLDPSGTKFNYTQPTDAELAASLPSYKENPFFWDCVEDYKEDYDKSESVSRDLCKDLLK